MTITLPRRHFTADEYHRMKDAGIFPADTHVALTHGILYNQDVVDRSLPRPYHFTLNQYERLHEAGILDEDEHIELIAGEIVEMSAMGHRHERCIDLLTRLLVRSVSDDLLVHVQNPVRISTDGAPQPDLAVIYDRGPDGSGVTEADVLCVVEVSDTTLTSDREIKLPLYARAGIPETWLVDVNAGVVERHTAPRGGEYQRIETARAGETLASLAVPSVRIPIADILH